LNNIRDRPIFGFYRYRPQ